MFFFGKALPLLFATPSYKSTSIRTTSLLHSTVQKEESIKENVFNIGDDSIVSPPRKIIDDVDEMFLGLSQGCYTYESSPTIQFMYTSPLDERLHFKAEMEQSILKSGETIYDEIMASHHNTKPLLLYLPGLDGAGLSASRQFDDLSRAFEFWRMTIDKVDDRSSFTELTTTVSAFIKKIATEQNRDVILVGESFGGLLAPAVALRLQAISDSTNTKNPIKGMVMINPATSFEKTQWSTLAPILASLRHIEQEEEEGTPLRFPTPYSIAGGLALAALIPDSTQFRSILDIFTETKVSTADELQDIVRTLRDGFGILADNLPAKVVEFRVAQWLPVGCDVVLPRLHKIDVPTLVIAGEDDNMLPSKGEAERLVQVMKNCTSLSVKGSGHLVLDQRFNLTEAIIDGPFDPFGKSKDKKKYDPIADWKPPSDDAIREAIDNRVKPFRIATSPKFFSTGLDGKRRLGLGQVPNNQDGPVLFVGNHQLLGLDLGPIVAELLEQRGIFARGLAHPLVYQAGNGFGAGAGPTGPSRRTTKRDKDGVVDPPPGDFQTFGAVMVTPRNYYRLMQTGQVGLLFPGGVREVFHGKDEAYELFWPEKVDFVRVAARFNATIVPISAVGAADSANILIDSSEIVNLPFGIGERAMSSSKNLISARFNQGNEDELFVPPLVVPKLTPARHYFIFGKPFDTSTIDTTDKDACTLLYRDVKTELRRGLDDLLVARESDPYKNFAKRIAIEQVLGKQAPTFPIEELNK